MPDLSQVQPTAFNCQGGLVLNRSTFMMQPGEALELQNFEPDIKGGYRRINGFSKYVNAVVPQTSSSTEPVLMVATFGDLVVAARGEKIFSATAGGSSWTERDTGRTSAGTYAFERYNFDGNDKLIVVDGANAPTFFNSAMSATDVSNSDVAGSKFVTAFKSHMFYAGKSSTPQTLVFSQPFDEDALMKSIEKTNCLISVEEHSIYGGLGERCASLISQAGYNLKFKILGIPDEYMINGSQADVLDYYNMSPEKISEIFKDIFDNLFKKKKV